MWEVRREMTSWKDQIGRRWLRSKLRLVESLITSQIENKTQKIHKTIHTVPTKRKLGQLR